MPYLIATTDFSKTSTNAVNYACSMAVAYQLDVVVLHCYSLPITFADVPLPSPVNEAELAAKDGMDLLMTELGTKFPQLHITNRIVYGDLISTLQEITEDNVSPFLAVTGNSHSVENPAWMDSTVLQAFRQVKFPVLAIPEDADYHTLKKIGFAYDNKYTGSDVALVQLRELTKTLDVELHVFYAVPEKHGMEAAINEAAKKILDDVQPLYHIYQQTDVETGINSFVSQYHIDWLILMPRKHNLLESIFHRSQTKATVNHSVVPVLALHENS